jgi:hypothetical protein
MTLEERLGPHSYAQQLKPRPSGTVAVSRGSMPMEDWLEFMLRRGEELARRVIITGSMRTGRTWSRRLYGPTWQSLRHKAKAESFMKTLKESE